MQNRVCIKCKLEKTLTTEFFKKLSKKKDGTQSFTAKCRDCLNIEANQRLRNRADFDYSNIDFTKKKICTKCKKEKTLLQFTKDKKSNSGFTSHCNSCRSKRSKYYNEEINPNYKKIYYEKNSEKEKLRKRKWYKQNRDIALKQSKDWYKNNIERKAESVKKWRKDNLEHYRKVYRENKKIKMDNDPLFKLSAMIRSRISIAFKSKGYKKNSKTEKLLGANFNIVKNHIEKQFTKKMSWDNYGEWHIDHIIPLSSANDKDELEALSYYKNLQPLMKIDNLLKSDKYSEKDKIKYLQWFKKNMEEN